MEPKYTSVAAMISFEDFPDNDKLMVALQDAWFALAETYDFVDRNSGSLSVPIEADDGTVVYVYTMRAYDNQDILFIRDGE